MTTTTPSHDDKDAEIARLRAELDAIKGAPTAPTFPQRVDELLPGLTPNTRRTFDTHYRRLLVGVGLVCDQACEPCVTDPDALCPLRLPGLRKSRIRIPAGAGSTTSPPSRRPCRSPPTRSPADASRPTWWTTCSGLPESERRRLPGRRRDPSRSVAGRGD